MSFASNGASRRGARLEDVAAAAGVSLSTASKALHHRPRISEATRRRVLDAARRLEYSPNKSAQSLARGRTDLIGVVTYNMRAHCTGPVLAGIEQELSSRSIGMLLGNAGGDASMEPNQVERLLAMNVDGLIVVHDETNPHPALGDDWGVPIVYAYGPSTNPLDCSVTCDNLEAGRMAVNHLIACGRHRIAVIAGDKAFIAAVDRLKGTTEALTEIGLEPVLPVRYGTWNESWGREETLRLLDSGEPFDAVVCQNDPIARGCLDTLREHGVNVPDEVAVIGHDNREGYTLGSRPTLTSIANGGVEIGRQSARYLLDAIDGRVRHGVDYVPCHLVQHESTRPLD
ncbi:LacI family DNA-binding transcriptional regulator [Bifidobacterium platyrrhinorum]|uniref:Substrate-binding domain-containing protein n=1 Tax=Bifidobacterium platyrrhinorum TaxID=2661628 RepID=A0A6L9SR64_9BIFI|nr:LacI family DNA-binding transcriptional regulator [Bifidobacterium platyrrhinorum]NEG54938.1 substrate-binding domain-containing protein [Bifidobacterium platyrrhinorum]